MEAGNTDFVYKNDLGKSCFQHDMACGKSKYLTRRTQSDKVLRDKAFEIVSIPKYDGYQRGLASIVYKFFIKSLVEGVLLLCQIINLQMNFKGRSLENSRQEKFIYFLETIFGVLRLKANNLLCAIDLYSKYAWIVPFVNAFQKTISKGRKTNNQGGEFCNNLFKRFLKINNIEMYSTFNERKCIQLLMLLLKDLLEL